MWVVVRTGRACRSKPLPFGPQHRLQALARDDRARRVPDKDPLQTKKIAHDGPRLLSKTPARGTAETAAEAVARTERWIGPYPFKEQPVQPPCAAAGHRARVVQRARQAGDVATAHLRHNRRPQAHPARDWR